jgi:hypothetical protein
MVLMDEVEGGRLVDWLASFRMREDCSSALVEFGDGDPVVGRRKLSDEDTVGVKRKRMAAVVASTDRYRRWSPWKICGLV